MIASKARRSFNIMVPSRIGSLFTFHISSHRRPTPYPPRLNAFFSSLTLNLLAHPRGRAIALPRVRRLLAQLLLDAQQLVVLGEAFGPARCARLDLVRTREVCVWGGGREVVWVRSRCVCGVGEKEVVWVRRRCVVCVRIGMW